MISVNFSGQITVVKSNDFIDRTGSDALFLYRNPFDTLWETWKWWNSIANKVVIASLRGRTFFEFIRGYLGDVVGFQGMPCQAKDSLLSCRGMFYNPCKFWEQHVTEGFMEAKWKLSMESIYSDPEATLTWLATTFSLDRPSQWEISPSLLNAAPGKHMSAYSGGMAQEVAARLDSTMQLLGYSLDKTSLVVSL